MHMADALISPTVGGTMWLVTAGLIAYCARKVKQTMKDNLVPMMGVMGAFIFAAQMINFSIPGTGSSGHLGGGLILSILLGPHAAFLVISSVLTVQALFFADGGLLALGCNIFNLGFFPAFIAYSFIYRPLAGGAGRSSRVWITAIVAAVVGLQLGAFSVVLETKTSGILALPFGVFALLMLPIHLAIGIVEGLATAAVVSFIAKTQPAVWAAGPATAENQTSPRLVLAGLAVAAVTIGGAVSWFASTHPDGLEWSLAKITSQEEDCGSADQLHKNLAHLQEKTAFLPDYGFKLKRRGHASGVVNRDACPALRGAAALPLSESIIIGRARASGPAARENTPAEPEWPAVSAGTSVSGILGGLLTLALAGLVGFALKARRIKI